LNTINRALGAMVIAAVVLGVIFGGYALLFARPQDLPWTPLDLNQPPGAFTGQKISGLRDDFAECRTLLTAAGADFMVLPAIAESGGRCGYADGVRFAGGTRDIAFSPRPPGISCPVAAGLTVFERFVVQPAAEKHFGERVVRIEHLGSYNCRRIYGRAKGDWSEHAHANAIDLAGFVLADGTRISVERDWKGKGERAAFLRQVRNGACRLFATVLSPDYNAAHRDHFHFDQAARGALGRRACR
jgi:hypothetical protein